MVLASGGPSSASTPACRACHGAGSGQAGKKVAAILPDLHQNPLQKPAPAGNRVVLQTLAHRLSSANTSFVSVSNDTIA